MSIGSSSMQTVSGTDLYDATKSLIDTICIKPHVVCAFPTPGGVYCSSSQLHNFGDDLGHFLDWDENGCPRSSIDDGYAETVIIEEIIRLHGKDYVSPALINDIKLIVEFMACIRCVNE